MTAEPASLDADEPAPARRGIAQGVGHAALTAVRAATGVYSVLVKTLYYLVRGVRQPGAIARQMYAIGNESLVFLCVVMGFLGMIVVYQTGLQLQRVVPDLGMLGANFVDLLVRELVPSICALMLATRVGAGIAAEIGSMVVTEQVDALRMCAADPVDYLIKPRFVASVVMTLVLSTIAGTVAWVAGMVTAGTFFNITPGTFINLSLVGVGDAVSFVTKCVAYGAAIPVVSGYCGLVTYGGSEGVGWATTSAVVSSSLSVVVLDFFISGACYLVFG